MEVITNWILYCDYCLNFALLSLLFFPVNLINFFPVLKSSWVLENPIFLECMCAVKTEPWYSSMYRKNIDFCTFSFCFVCQNKKFT